MARLNAYQRYLVEEFAEEYLERRMSRRDLLRRAVLVTGSIPAAATALAALGCGPGSKTGDEPSVTPSASGGGQTPAASPPSTTPTATAATPVSTASTQPAGVVPADVRFKGPASDLLGYLARPARAGSNPGVLVIHENRGLNDHIRDVARRLAGEGFVALAVDLVSRDGGSQADTAQNTGFLGRANPDDLIADLRAYGAHLAGLEGVRPGGIGVVGFCFGGGYTFEAAIGVPGVGAAVPFYGICRLIDQLPRTTAAVLAIYGERDTRVTAQAEPVRAALTTAGRPFDVRVYPGVNHAFFNDTGANYDAAAAADAWQRTLAWFRTHLPS